MKSHVLRASPQTPAEKRFSTFLHIIGHVLYHATSLATNIDRLAVGQYMNWPKLGSHSFIYSVFKKIFVETLKCANSYSRHCVKL